MIRRGREDIETDIIAFVYANPKSSIREIGYVEYFDFELTILLCRNCYRVMRSKEWNFAWIPEMMVNYTSFLTHIIRMNVLMKDYRLFKYLTKQNALGLDSTKHGTFCKYGKPFVCKSYEIIFITI